LRIGGRRPAGCGRSPHRCCPEPFAVTLSPFACHSERSEESAVCSLRENFAKDLHLLVFKEILQMLRSAQHDREPFSGGGIGFIDMTFGVLPQRGVVSVRSGIDSVAPIRA